MASEQSDPIDAAIQSAETLFANLLERSATSSLTSLTRGVPLSTESIDLGELNPEHSIVPNQSLTTIGAASSDPSHLTAQAHAVLPLELESIDPRQSLTALAIRSSTSLVSDSPPSYDVVCKMLKERERDVELAARIGQALLRRNEMLDNDLSLAVDQRQQLEQQVAQLSHTIGQKDELLKLYARDAHETEMSKELVEEGEESSPGWVQALAEECRELRESNLVLKAETFQLRKETAEIEQKEKELVQNCLEQFSEAKRRLGELREDMETKQQECQQLQNSLQELSEQYEDQLSTNHQLTEDSEILREQLADSQSAQSLLTTEVTELHERCQEMSVHLKETKDELATLKELNSSAGGNGEHTITDQESIVREIEEVLRKELIAASTLPERPRSPNHYARQRTMVVMETVRAATLATARRRERLSAETEKVKGQEKASTAATTSTPMSSKVKQAFSPIAASSPGDFKKSHKSIATATGTGTTIATPPVTPRGACPPSPILSEAGSTMSYPDEHIRYRNQTYIAPEKLQIVKPMEGSVTLLKWKLLATPQLGGTKTFFSDASRPGVHLKKWKAGGVRDSNSLAVDEMRMKSLSVNDLSRMNSTFPEASKSRVSRKESLRNKNRQSSRLSVSDLETRPEQGMNNVSGLIPQAKDAASPSAKKTRDGAGRVEADEQTSSSLLSTVGSFLGSGWSRLTSFSSPNDKTNSDHQQKHQQKDVQNTTNNSSAGNTSTSGLAGLL